METVVILIMALACLSALLKLSFHGWRGQAALSLAAAAAVCSAADMAASQSRQRIAGWLEQPGLMLDATVWLTLDVGLAIAFCILAAAPRHGREAMLAKALLWFPGFMLFPSLFALLAWLIFSLPGTDFTLTGCCLGAAVLTGFPLLARVLGWLLPEREIRLELLFLLSLMTAGLGVAAAVNGRTAVEGSAEIEWKALGASLLLLAASAAAGLAIHKIQSERSYKKTKKT